MFEEGKKPGEIEKPLGEIPAKESFLPKTTETEAEDIFAESGKKESVEPVKIAIPRELIRRKKGLPKIFIFVIVLVALVGFIFLFSYFGILRLEQKGKSLLNQPATPVGIITPGPQILDSDGDGLTDTEEQTLGTNINSADSDQDELFDREEVKVYQTDPLNPDTDNDGYKDGEELKTGYDPKNPSPQAKLFDLKTEIEKIK